jgi:hypothetical protein
MIDGLEGTTLCAWMLMCLLQLAQIGILFIMVVKHMDWDCAQHHLTLQQCRSMDRGFIAEMAVHGAVLLLLASLPLSTGLVLFTVHAPLMAMSVQKVLSGKWRVDPASLWRESSARKRDIGIRGVAHSALFVGTIVAMFASH